MCRAKSPLLPELCPKELPASERREGQGVRGCQQVVHAPVVHLHLRRLPLLPGQLALDDPRLRLGPAGRVGPSVEKAAPPMAGWPEHQESRHSCQPPRQPWSSPRSRRPTNVFARSSIEAQRGGGGRAMLVSSACWEVTGMRIVQNRVSPTSPRVSMGGPAAKGAVETRRHDRGASIQTREFPIRHTSASANPPHGYRGDPHGRAAGVLHGAALLHAAPGAGRTGDPRPRSLDRNCSFSAALCDPFHSPAPV